MKKKIALLMAMVMLFGMTVAGTLAWLQAKSETVTNTFTVGDINITLDESELVDGELDVDTRTQTNSYATIPGVTYPKDPTVKVLENSEACWLFVEFKEVNNTFGNPVEKYITFAMDNNVWTKLSDTVYYTEVSKADATAGKTYNVIKDTTVTVNSDITKTDIPAEGSEPQLIFKAFAVQKEAAADAATAWGLVPETEKLA